MVGVLVMAGVDSDEPELAGVVFVCLLLSMLDLCLVVEKVL